MLNSHKNYRLVLLLSLLSAFFVNSWVVRTVSAKDDLCYFDSKKIAGDLAGCSKDMDVEIREIGRENQKSVVQIKVRKRGTHAGLIMFQLCCFANIAKSRGYRYFMSLDTKKSDDCKECERSWEETLGFLKSESDSISELFRLPDSESGKYKIEDINKYSEFCRFVPIPSSEFHKAIYFGDLKKAAELSKNHPELPNAKDEEGYSPLHLASAEGHSEIIRFLLLSGADINSKAKYGWTPLHLAIVLRQIDIVKLLLDMKADTQARDNFGNSALHTAAYGGFIEAADLLVNSGIKIDITDYKENTPLHAAASRNQIRMVKYLLSKGAISDKKNNAGKTPLSFAEERDYAEVIAILKGSKPRIN